MKNRKGVERGERRGGGESSLRVVVGELTIPHLLLFLHAFFLLACFYLRLMNEDQ